MFLFGRRKMRFRKRHVPTEPIKVVQLPDTGIGGFISQSASQRRTVTANSLSVWYDIDIKINCYNSVRVRSIVRVRDVCVSKVYGAFIFSVYGVEGLYKLRRWMTLFSGKLEPFCSLRKETKPACQFRKIGAFLVSHLRHLI
jgi:hypothetical protein